MLQFLHFRGMQLGQDWSHGIGLGAGAEDGAGCEQDTWLLSREMGSTRRGVIRRKLRREVEAGIQIRAKFVMAASGGIQAVFGGRCGLSI